MTKDETGQTLKYDPWGRLVEINTDGTGAVEITNVYDAAGRRIKRNSNEFYYTAQWQQIEERDAQGVEAQFVWSPVYIDAMVLKDRDSDNDGVMEGTDERLYVVHDGNFNITGLLDASGIVLERFIYDAYGTRSVLDANWSADADNTSDYGFDFGHQGGLHDLLAGLVYFRFRWLDTSLGRWERQDPEGHIEGLNAYAYLRVTPGNYLDPFGNTSRRDQGGKNPPGTGSCKVRIRCNNLHCGIVLRDDDGNWFTIDGTGRGSSGPREDSNKGSDGTVYNGVVIKELVPGWSLPGRWESGWIELDPRTCDCLTKPDREKWFNKRMQDVGSEYDLDGPNSSFALKCYAKSCGVTITWTIKPPGWGDQDASDCDEVFCEARKDK